MGKSNLTRLKDHHYAIFFYHFAAHGNATNAFQSEKHARRSNGPLARTGHMVRNKLCWGANNAVGLSKQRNSYQSSPTFLCFLSPTALFASQHNLFRSMWPAHDAKGLFRFKGRPILKLLARSIIRSLNCTLFGPITVTTWSTAVKCRN